MTVENLAGDIIQNVSKVIFGKKQEIKYILTALFSEGHVLLDDYPGTGKTSLARAIAVSISGRYSRIQFTPDLLPSDITGINYYNAKQGEFIFREGPVFSNIVIADEINRATPRTQSALLECMGESQVTVDGKTYTLDAPFIVLATQNPIDQQGTFMLPEAQSDRFMMKLSLGYPDSSAEMDMLNNHIGKRPLRTLPAVCSKGDVAEATQKCENVSVSPKIKEYVISIVTETRRSDRLSLGVSPRGTLALLRASQAYAAISGRDYVLPDDVKAVAVPVLTHRVIPSSQSRLRLARSSQDIIESIIDAVPSPVD